MQMMRYQNVLVKCLACLLALLISGCAGSTDQSPSPETSSPEASPSPSETVEPSEEQSTAKEGRAPTPQRVKQFIGDALQSNAEVTPADVERRLGAPESIEAKPIENEHDPSQTDTLRTLVYEGLQVEFYDVSGSGKQMLRRITLTGDQYTGPRGLHPGISQAAVKDTMGAPSRTEQDRLIYEAGDPTPTFTIVHFNGDAAARIEWSFYVD